MRYFFSFNRVVFSPAMAKNRSRASGRWLQEHFNDHYVKEAQRQGYRSRAAFKLLEINLSEIAEARETYSFLKDRLPDYKIKTQG